MSNPLELRNIHKTFKDGESSLHILRGVDFQLKPNEIVALMAPSGTGKSTLLHIAGLLESADSGSVIINGQDVLNLSDSKRTVLRRDCIGFVYQFHHLLAEFTAVENVMLPQMLQGIARRSAMTWVSDLLEQFGLSKRGHHLPGKLSGGEQQRVAIARALVNTPHILLADEPTGNLDVSTAEKVFACLLDAVRGQGVSALIATHNMELAKRMDRIVTLQDGIIQEII
jgi:lipoprotein-releasing system ATP-binding protein